jgi:Tfp pilus assembly protein PilO
MTAKRFFSVLALGLGLALVGLGYGYEQALHNLQQQKTNYAQRLSDLQLANDKLNQLSDLQSQYDRLSPIIGNLDAILPHDKQQSTIAIELYNAAQANGMQLSSLAFPPPDGKLLPGPTTQTFKAGGVLATSAHFTLIGTYAQLHGFLATVEHLKRLSSVTSLAIQAPDKTAAASARSYDLIVDAYLKP